MWDFIGSIPCVARLTRPSLRVLTPRLFHFFCTDIALLHTPVYINTPLVHTLVFFDNLLVHAPVFFDNPLVNTPMFFDSRLLHAPVSFDILLSQSLCLVLPPTPLCVLTSNWSYPLWSDTPLVPLYPFFLFSFFFFFDIPLLLLPVSFDIPVFSTRLPMCSNIPLVPLPVFSHPDGPIPYVPT